MAALPKEVGGKPAQEVRSVLESKFGVDGNIDETHIKQLDRPTKVKLNSAISTYCKNYPESELAKLRNGAVSDLDRRKLCARFLMHSQDGARVAKTTTSVVNSTRAVGKGGWKYYSQIVTLMGGDTDLADDIIEGAPEQPAEHAAARKKGKTQYWVDVNETVKSTGVDEKTSVEQSAEITAEQYDVLKSDMSNLMTGPSEPVDLPVANSSSAPAILDGQADGGVAIVLAEQPPLIK